MATNKKSNDEAKASEFDMTAVQQQIEAMLAEAKAEVERIKAEAKAQLELAKEEKASTAADDDAYLEELVEIELFKDGGKYKEDVFVGVNGETIAIKRGERVKVKRKFAEALSNSKTQDAKTAKLIERRAEEFAKTGL